MRNKKRIAGFAWDRILPIVVLLAGAAFGLLLVNTRSGQDPNPVEQENVGLQGITCLAIDREGILYAGGAFGVKKLDERMQPVAGWPVEGEITSIAVDEQGSVYVACVDSVYKFSPEGESLGLWGRSELGPIPFGFITGIAVAKEDIFVADARNALVYRFDTEGELRNEIDGKIVNTDGKGFLIPSPYFDCAILGDRLHITDPGRLQVEIYDFKGNLITYWGEAGTAPGQFPGCCNPSNIALFPDGRAVVSQKGEPCVKVFSPEGELIEVFGEDVFSKSTKGIDLVVSGRETIYATDPKAGLIRVFKTQRFEEYAAGA